MLSRFWEIMTTPREELQYGFLTDYLERIEDQAVQWLFSVLFNGVQQASLVIVSSPILILNSPEFNYLYTLTARLTAVAVTFFLISLGIRAMNGTVDYTTILSTLCKLLFLLPLGIGITRPLAVTLITLYNNVAIILLNNAGHPLADTLEPSQLHLRLIVFLVVYVVLLYSLTLFYFIRNFKLVFLVITAPFALLLWTIPAHSHRLEQWYEELVELLSIQLVHAFILLLMGWFSSVGGIGWQIGALYAMSNPPKFLAPYVKGLNPVALFRTPINNIKRSVKNAVSYSRYDEG